MSASARMDSLEMAFLVKVRTWNAGWLVPILGWLEKHFAVEVAKLMISVKAYLHGTTLSHATSLRQAYDMT